ncbi:MAG: NUDIX hydrolase [bacterium]|nr:NUDIX hydrolase [bacterium]
MRPDGKGKTTILGEGTWLRLVDRDTWEHVERKRVTGVVAMVAVTDAREIVLVEQFRMALQTRTIELPAGLVGDIPGGEDEQMVTAARRELIEETGYDPSDMRVLTVGPTSSGICSETITFYLATGLTRVGEGGGDHSEDITVHVVPLDGADAWLEEQTHRGVLIDPKVYAGLYFAGRPEA